MSAGKATSGGRKAAGGARLPDAFLRTDALMREMTVGALPGDAHLTAHPSTEEES
ncbi:hypothetical protein GCM10008937_23890 [Deinococcus depolymerans]|uniref:Uncharacterized protein n=1 Tax=Deinococcus depolymerans TaxID=392408 RepID=A0ABP3M8L6_9DEIO